MGDNFNANFNGSLFPDELFEGNIPGGSEIRHPMRNGNGHGRTFSEALQQGHMDRRQTNGPGPTMTNSGPSTRPLLGSRLPDLSQSNGGASMRTGCDLELNVHRMLREWPYYLPNIPSNNPESGPVMQPPLAPIMRNSMGNGSLPHNVSRSNGGAAKMTEPALDLNVHKMLRQWPYYLPNIPENNPENIGKPSQPLRTNLRNPVTTSWIPNTSRYNNAMNVVNDGSVAEQPILRNWSPKVKRQLGFPATMGLPKSTFQMNPESLVPAQITPGTVGQQRAPTHPYSSHPSLAGWSEQPLTTLYHAYRCLKNERRLCNQPSCVLMKEFIKYVRTCRRGINCSESNCVNGFKIMTHWDGCRTPNCPFCLQVRGP